ncbi:hypothetical protein IE5_05830 [Bacillus cereus BAG3X2-2]|uniref:hypothetical protein n=1 Tax=Bacillus cereus TaxID=1396 RepID=UPI000279385C|nr:hypothetical protein [Bacillus cereus]EJQ14136.1 hypothetical protein IE5_05830 [Bacillus cereus BAG3X2-2]
MKKNLFYIGFIAFVLFVALVGYGGYLENEKRLAEGLRKEVLIVDKDKRMSSTGLMSSPKYSVKFYVDKKLHDIDVNSSVYEKSEVGSKLKVIEYKNQIVLE